MQLKQILKVTLSLIQLRTFGDIAITTDVAYVSTVTSIECVSFTASLIHRLTLTRNSISFSVFEKKPKTILWIKTQEDELEPCLSCN